MYAGCVCTATPLHLDWVNLLRIQALLLNPVSTDMTATGVNQIAFPWRQLCRGRTSTPGPAPEVVCGRFTPQVSDNQDNQKMSLYKLHRTGKILPPSLPL